MHAIKNHIKPSLLLSILQNKCTRCRKGKMYRFDNPYQLKNTMKMHDRCLVCKQPLNMEPGFYYGTNMVSYALAVLFSITGFILWFILIGFSVHDQRFFWWMGINALLLVALQPPLMRLSRTIWLAFFVKYSPRWDQGDIMEPERVSKEHENNW